MDILLPKAINIVLQTLHETAYEAYLIGGCVRDYLLGKIPHDFDITTSAHPQEVKQLFAAYPVIETGMIHGTVTVVISDYQIEVTTYRTDLAYEDHRRPVQVAFGTSLLEDVKRRDFTINALAYHPQEGIVDLVDGLQDLNQKRLQCVGDPLVRFQEDALRILRCLRFASVLSFVIEEKTHDALFQKQHLLSYISWERKWSELEKLLAGDAVDEILRTYREIVLQLLPEFKHAQLLPLASLPKHAVLRLGFLLAPLDVQTIKTIGLRLRLSNSQLKELKAYAKYRDHLADSEYEVKCLLRELGKDQTKKLLEGQAALHGSSESLQWMESILTQGKVYQMQQLAVNGHDLLKHHLGSGSELKQLLNDLLDQVMQEKLENKKHVLLEKASTWKKRDN